VTPGFLELTRLGRRELPERDADFHSELAHLADRPEHLLEARIAAAHAFPSRAHAKAGRAILAGAAGDFHHLLGLHELLGLDARLVAGALRAVAAILGAATGLDAEQGAELHFVFAPVREVGIPPLLDEVEERLVVERLKLRKSHARRVAGEARGVKRGGGKERTSNIQHRTPNIEGRKHRERCAGVIVLVLLLVIVLDPVTWRRRKTRGR
jgi:hypothetical protein